VLRKKKVSTKCIKVSTIFLLRLLIGGFLVFFPYKET